MQVVNFTYSGSATRKLTVSGRDSVIIAGDDVSTKFVFNFPEAYKNFSKVIAWDFNMYDSEGNVVQPRYALSNNEFLVPYEVTVNNSGKLVGFNLILSDPESDLVETSLTYSVYISKSVKSITDPVYTDVLTQLVTKAYVSSAYDIDAEKDRPVITFTTMGGSKYTLVLEDIPYLGADSRLDKKFMPIGTYVQLFQIDDVSKLTTLDAHTPDMALVTDGVEKGNIYILKGENASSREDWVPIYSQTQLDNKTNILEAIPHWSSDVSYIRDSTVVYEGIIYISLKDNNLNNPPPDSTTAWSKIKSEGESQGQLVVTSIGNGVDKEYVISHNLNTYNFLYQIRYSNPKRQYIDATIFADTLNTAKVVFNSPPKDNEVTVIISPGNQLKDVDNNQISVNAVIGDGINTEYAVFHNFGSYNFLYSLRYNDDTREYVDAYIEAVSPDAVIVKFNSPPKAGQYVLIITKTGAVATVSDKIQVHVQSAPANTWIIDYGLNRMAMVQVCDSNGVRLSPYIYQNPSNMNEIEIGFNKPMSGTAIIM